MLDLLVSFGICLVLLVFIVIAVIAFLKDKANGHDDLPLLRGTWTVHRSRGQASSIRQLITNIRAQVRQPGAIDILVGERDRRQVSTDLRVGALSTTGLQTL